MYQKVDTTPTNIDLPFNNDILSQNFFDKNALLLVITKEQLFVRSGNSDYIHGTTVGFFFIACVSGGVVR